MADEWKELYKKAQEPKTAHSGPVLYYNDLVVDHFTNPRNVGELENPDAEAVIGDPSCGDQMRITIKVDSDKIIDIKFKSDGCQGAIAANSMMTELAKGKTIKEAQRLTDDDVITALGGIPEGKELCSLIGVAGLQEVIKDYLKRQSQVEN
jgi:NifU-like protein involved in Fe-S cluster formation